MIWSPCGVCTTSGWNWIATCPAWSAIAATGTLSDCAIARKPGGSCATLSPCYIHTGSEAGSPLKSALPLSETFSTACPYSRLVAGSTRPPSACASSCIP